MTRRPELAILLAAQLLLVAACPLGCAALQGPESGRRDSQRILDALELRPPGADRGVELVGSTVAEVTSVSRGAAARATSARLLAAATLSADLDTWLGVPGASALLDVRSFAGELASDDAGDFQGISSLDADASERVSELWYAQSLAGETADVKVGVLDSNARFAAIDAASEFFNSSVATSPTIVGFPTWPETALGVEAFLDDAEHGYLGVGLYDGPATESLTGAPAAGGAFAIAEGGVRLPWAGRIGVGAWHNRGSFERFAGGTERGTEGYYALWEHHVWREHRPADDAEGLHAFAMLGLADDAVSEAGEHRVVGLRYQGLIPRRDRDAAGVAISRVDLSPAAGFVADETMIEAHYKAWLTGFASVQIGAQHLSNPGGTGDGDAFAFGVRVELTL